MDILEIPFHKFLNLKNKKRTITQIKVEILDQSKKKVLTAIFDWFLAFK